MTFDFFFGGFLGESYALRFQDGVLLYQAYQDHYELRLTETINPDDKAWRLFKAAIDKIFFQSWQQEYVDPGYCDGTRWSVEIEYPDLIVKSAGSNSYPGKNGEPSNNYNRGEFERLMKSVRKFIAERAFRQRSP